MKLLHFVLCVSLSCFCHLAHADVCQKLRQLFVSGEFTKHSVRHVETNPDPEYMKYEFDLDGNGEKDYVEAYCGNGRDAVCEMTFFLNGLESFDFSLPTTIRFIELDKNIYIINGVSIYARNKIRTRNYTVHQLLPKELKLICDRF